MHEEVDVWSGSPSQVIEIGTYIGMALQSLFAIYTIVAVPFENWKFIQYVVVPLSIFYLPFAIWTWLDLKNVRYELTSQRLKIHSGILSKKVEELELYRVKDMRCDHPFIQRLFGFGNVLLVSSDSTTPVVVIKGVHDASDLREKLRGLVEVRREQKRVRVTEFE